MPVTFTLQVTDGSGARAGLLTTAHGDVPTPMFMAVGTQATVKTLDPADLAALRVPIILANTYHLYLRPGLDVIDRFEGVHRFMHWPGPLLTDSGGFQVFSLADRRVIDDDGVTFRSHLDGSSHRFTPASAMAIQRSLGADICMAFDECIPAGADLEYSRISTDRTHRWAALCREQPLRDHQAVFGIVQGGTDAGLRRWSARSLAAMDFPGYGIGGLSVGEAKAVTWDLTAEATAELPADRPRYLMGVGSPEDLVVCIGHGVDLFDCVLPTRIARNGALFTPDGRVNLHNARWATEAGPIDADCACSTCQRFSAAYLHHLFRARETLALRLASIHNLHFMLRLVERARLAVLSGTYGGFQHEFLARYRTTDQATRHSQKQRWLTAQGRG